MGIMPRWVLPHPLSGIDGGLSFSMAVRVILEVEVRRLWVYGTGGDSSNDLGSCWGPYGPAVTEV